MRKPVVVISLFLLLFQIGVVTGCRGTREPDDARLVVADSLLASDSDSALALIKTLAPADFATDGDRAYRDLLLTQARYKCYITATSDSDINRALDYYRAHSGDQEKLTRAYIYKGAVMEELGYPDSAMFYYKHAETTAAPDDYFNLGYVNMRMGTLYRDQFAQDGMDIHKYEEALRYFILINEKQYRLKCMINLSNLYRLKYPIKADSLYKSAMSLAITQNDTVNYVIAAENLIKNYYLLGDYDGGRSVVHKLITDYENYIGISLCLNASLVYAKLNSIDSAQMFIDLAGPSIINEIDRIAYYESIAEISLAKGDTTKYSIFESIAIHLEDSLRILDNSHRITVMEEKVNEQSKRVMQKKQKTLIWQIYLITIIALCSIVLCFYFFYTKLRNARLINALRNENKNHLINSELLKQNIVGLRIQDKHLKEFIRDHMNMLGDVTEACYHTPNNVLSKEINSIIRFHKKNSEMWERLYEYINMEYNNLISDTKKNYKNLKSKDILLLALTCLDYSCAQIAIITGYSNATSISGNRQRLARKMGLDCSLNDYIAKYKS